MRQLDTSDSGFAVAFADLCARNLELDTGVDRTVAEIVDRVRDEGDEALFEFTRRFDGLDLEKTGIEVEENEIDAAVAALSATQLADLELAVERITAYHQRQLRQSWFDDHEAGVLLGQKITPLERVGIYVPGGKAAYPSSVLMNALPARVAGVGEIIMVSPAAAGYTPAVLAAARLAGVDRIFRIGGAQAVAALAYGTASVPAVDKIVGPGNIYVALAKRRVFGQVGIDMVAGPSEIMVVADESADPVFIAADLLSQAEHDELAAVVLVTPSAVLLQQVMNQLGEQLSRLSRREIAEKSLAGQSALVLTADLDEALDLANRFAAEHLELAVADPLLALSSIRNAGAVFLGHSTPEALGDYLAGPNHVLPTAGTARFSSPLSVDDFLKKSSVLSFSPAALARYGRSVTALAALEGLEAHGRAVSLRLEKESGD
ncbi:MAG: histidinol dehydrogenase [Deltaproteobacteria bacterium]|nr:histidinol dehydrogenase [Deltaproteobacteria bacterium]